MKTRTYRGFTIEQRSSTEFVIRRRGEYLDTASALWLATKRIDQVAMGA